MPRFIQVKERNQSTPTQINTDQILYFFYNPQYDNTNIYVTNPDTEFVVEGDMTDEILGIKKACWVKMEGMMPPEFHGHYECSKCGWHGKNFEKELEFDHCPGCGAKMRETI